MFTMLSIDFPASETDVLSGRAKANSVCLQPEVGSPRLFGMKATIIYTDNDTEEQTFSFNAHYSDWQYLSVPVLPKKSNKTVAEIWAHCTYNYNGNFAIFEQIALTISNVTCYTYDNKGNL